MPTQVFAQTVLNGLILGSNYALLSSGFSLVYGVMRLLNFAHGELYMLSGYLLFVALNLLHLPYFVAAPIAIVITGMVSAVLERVFFRPFRASHDVTLIMALALSLFIAGTVFASFGPAEKVIPSYVRGSLNVGGMSAAWERIIIMPVTAALILGLWFFLEKTQLGRALRATAQDAEAVGLMGVNLDRMHTFGFAVSGALAAFAGCLVIPLFYLNPFVGGMAIFKILIVVVIGGLGSVAGAIAAGLLIGLVESFGYAFLGGLASIVPFIFAMLILIFRPRGLMGRF